MAVLVEIVPGRLEMESWSQGTISESGDPWRESMRPGESLNSGAKK